MTDKQREDLNKLIKELDRYNDVHKKWIEYTRAYQVIAFCVGIICMIMTILYARGF